MTRESAEVTLQGITKSYGNRTVLDNLDLSLRGGELLALLGPSGCGKTTILRVLAGLEAPDAGRVVIGGQDMTHTKVRDRGIGIVFQAYSLFPHLTALENVAYGLKIAGASTAKRTARAKELLETVGLGEHGAQSPHRLSGGQQQRVALARALAIEPRVLLLDEPLSALDAQVRVQLREEIRRIQTQSGTTTLMVTHDQEEALTVADRVGVMANGVIQQLGSPQDIYQRPATAFVSEFVGTVNRIPVQRERDGVSVWGRWMQVSTGTPGVLPTVPLEALIRPEDLTLRVKADGVGIVSSMVLRGSVTSINVEVGGLGLRVDVPSHEAAGFALAQRVSVAPRQASVLVDAAKSSENPSAGEAQAGKDRVSRGVAA